MQAVSPDNGQDIVSIIATRFHDGFQALDEFALTTVFQHVAISITGNGGPDVRGLMMHGKDEYTYVRVMCLDALTEINTTDSWHGNVSHDQLVSLRIGLNERPRFFSSQRCIEHL